VKRQKKSVKTLAQNVQPIGRPKIITNEYIHHLRTLVEQSPQVYGYPFKRWTAAWLRHHLLRELGIEVSDRHINRLLQQMGLSMRRANPTPEQTIKMHPPTQILIRDLNPSAIPEFDWLFIERLKG
jgi:transposase